MNIALFLDAWTPMKNGVITSVQQLQEGLKERGHHVIVVTVQAKGYSSDDPDVLLIPQIEVDFRTKQGFGLAVPIRRRLLAHLKENKIEIIHCHTEFGIGLAGRWAASKLRVPRVTTTHTMYEMYSNYSVFFGMTGFWRAFYRYFMKGTSVIVAPSRKAVQYNETVVPKIPVQIVPNGIDMSRFRLPSFTEAESLAFRGQYGLGAKDRIIIFVGRLGPEKRVEELLATLTPLLRRHDDIKLVFVGDGPSREGLAAEAAIRGVGDKTVFSGFVDWHTVFRFLIMSELFVSASLSEVHSMTLIEAAMCSLPTVARRDDSNIDLVIDGKNGWLVDTDEELERRVEELMTDDGKLATFSASALEISRLFTAERHVSRMERLYEKTLQYFPLHLGKLLDPLLLEGE